MSNKPTTDRRSFLKMASIGSAGAVASAVSTKTTEAAEIKPKESSGYSETDYVKKVYELARF